MAERPLDSGRKDVLGRTVRVSGGMVEGRAVAPAPDEEVSGVADRSLRDVLDEIGDDPERIAAVFGVSLDDQVGEVQDRVRWGARVEQWAYQDVPVPFARDEFSEFDAFGDAWSQGVDDAMNWVQDRSGGDADVDVPVGVPDATTAMFKMPDDFHRRVRDIDDVTARFELATGFTVAGFDVDGDDGFDPLMVTVEDTTGVAHEVGYHHVDGLSLRDVNGPHITELFGDDDGAGLEMAAELHREVAGVAHMYGQSGINFYNEIKEHRS